MISITDIYASQNKYGVNAKVTDTDVLPYSAYLTECRRYFTDNTPREYYDWDKRKKDDFTDKLIGDFVRMNRRFVEGFVDENGDIMVAELNDQLITDIVDFGILRIALEDDDIQEIQINDFKTIYVVRHGLSSLFCDKNGKPYQFLSDEELHTTIDRLIYAPSNITPRMTKTNPLLNARTAEKGYRLSAVNSSTITPDSKVGNDFPVTTVTIRKYAPSKLTFDDFEANGTMTPEMSEFLRLSGQADIRLVCVGPTSSGKTTVLNAIAWEVDPELRLILIQNPTEIMIYDRSEETGANMRNTLHWEAQDLGSSSQDDPTTPTMSNLIAHTLRNTPDVVIPGEVRTADEFEQVDRVLKTGHRVLTTLHAYDGADAIARMATERATKGGSISDFISSLANSIDIVVSCRKLGDGSRHIMAIEELTGEVDETGTAVTKELFRYKLTGKTDKDPDTGKPIKIYGYFEQVNPISESLQSKFYSAGITKEQLSKFIDVNPVIEGKSNLPSQMVKNDLSLSHGDVEPNDFADDFDFDSDDDSLAFLGN